MRYEKIVAISLFLLSFSGAALALTCPQCGKNNPDDAKYCVSCGVAIKPSAGINDKLHQPIPVEMNGYKEILMGLQNKDGNFNTDITGYLYQDKYSKTTYHLFIQNNGNNPIWTNYPTDEYLIRGSDNNNYKPIVDSKEYPPLIRSNEAARITIFLESLPPSVEISKMVVMLHNRDVTMYFDKEMYVKGSVEKTQTEDELITNEEIAIYGEIQSVDLSSNSISVQYYDYDKDKECVISVFVNNQTKMSNFNSITDLRKGVWIDATYGRGVRSGKPILRKIKRDEG